MAESAKGHRAGARAAGPELSRDRRLRLPLRLPHGGACGLGRDGRVAVPAAVRLAERVRGSARPRRGRLPARADRPAGAGRAALRAGLERARDELDDQDRLDDRPRRPRTGCRGARRTARACAPASWGAQDAEHMLMRTVECVHGSIEVEADLRARLRLRDRGGELEARRQGGARRGRQRRRGDAAAARRHPPRDRRPGRPRGDAPSRPASAPSSCLSWREELSGPGDADEAGIASRERSTCGAALAGARQRSPTTRGAGPFSGPRSRSRD